MVPPKSNPNELLGAHVSTAGGVQTAPARGTAIGATAIQVFTKTPNQWKEPVVSEDQAKAFREELATSGVRSVVSHDSYLINLASPDPELSERSTTAFIAELTRCRALGIRFVVSHPGNYIDDHDAGLERNAKNYAKCLKAVPGDIMVLIEGTAGTGTALGRTFDELAQLRELIDREVRDRVGVCLDTCHLYSAGYDIAKDYEGVWKTFDKTVGMKLLGCLHLNDSKTPFASHKDRHELIAEGSLGAEPFRRIMRDPRFTKIPKILETPKGDDETANDLKMLKRLRGYAAK
ncbi:MAG: deoxyribonuclease IV [Gemmatimonadales bacterium]|nr:deoxyribonuclease IV [Gemmatimonadales bacterium]